MRTRNPVLVFASGLVVGVLGGLIGLGGAEFRLPLLIGVFGFAALPAVIVNKATSLVVVACSLPLRAGTVPLSAVSAKWSVIVILLSGSLVGAWFGAGWATRIASRTLSRVLSVLLVGIAGLLLFLREPAGAEGVPLSSSLVVLGVAAGFGIGVVAAIMGVAGGELLIPTIVLLFGVNTKLAGSLSLAVSLPTMIAAFTRYSRDRSFDVIRSERRFLLLIAAGSLVGAFLGGRLLGIVPSEFLRPFLALILCVSAVKVWRHDKAD